MFKVPSAILTMTLGITVALATETTVTNTDSLRVNTSASGDKVLADSAAYDAYPSGLPTPSFWLDAGDVSKLTLDGSDVKEIRSRVGSRFLTTDKTGATWTGWGDVGFIPPTCSYDTDLGANVIDFGTLGSRKALIFNPIVQDGEVEPRTCLVKIGTAIMIYGSQNTGGWLFGGGNNKNISWHRGLTYAGMDNTSQGWGPFNSLCCETEGNNAAAFWHGYTRHNGYEYIPNIVGFNGGWEVFSFRAQTAADAETLGAIGLGIGDARNYMSGRSGGMKIAEAIIYEDVLSVDQIEKVEKWLKWKWFGYRAPGENGHSRLKELVVDAPASASAGGMTELKVSAGQDLTVDLVRGGHNSTGDETKDDVLNVKGEGTVSLYDATRYNGKVVLNGSTLRQPRLREVPTRETLPVGLFLHIDPSDPTCVTHVEGEEEKYITRVDNLTSQLYGGKVISLRPPAKPKEADGRPWLKENATPTGLPLIDFGDWYSWSGVDVGGTTYYRGRYLDYYLADTAGGIYLTTAIAVIDARRGGGWLMNGGFQRAAQGAAQNYGLLQPENLADAATSLRSNPRLTPTNGCAYLNAELVPRPDITGYGNGLQVVALQIPGSSVARVGGYWSAVSGGLVLGELLTWCRPLSDTEIRDASAYLMKKWMGRVPSGYRDGRIAPDVQKLSVTGASVVDVAEGETLHVGKLSLAANLVKRGAGALEIEALDAERGCQVIAESGTVNIVSPGEPVSASSPAAAPALRLDPSETRTWIFKTLNGRSHVDKAFDYANGLQLFNSNSTEHAPFLNTDAEMVCNGLPVLDFGNPGAEYAGANSVSHALYFSRPIESARSVYAVWRVKPDNLAFFMGSCNYVSGANALTDWHRGLVGGTCKNAPLFHSANTAAAIRNGTTLVNGEVVDPLVWTPPADEWNLVEVHTTGPTHISALGTDRGTSRTGGMALGEVLVYERELSDREKVATRNYLMKKWFGKTDSELDPLPAPSAPASTVYTLTVEEDMSLSAISTFAVKHLQGGSDISKTGAGTLEVHDPVSYSGTVHVVAGTLKITSRGAMVKPEMPENGLLLQLDSENGLVTETNENGRIEVREWASANGSGWKAVDAKGTYAGLEVDSSPSLEAESEFEGRPSVRMRNKPNTGKTECFRLFSPNGEWKAITNICSALWVLGSQEGGGQVFGGGDHEGSIDGTGRSQYYAWSRGSSNGGWSSGTNPKDCIVSTSGYEPVYARAVFRVNEAQVVNQAEYPLTGGWDLVSCRLAEGESAPADGLACDGRIFIGQDYRNSCGAQRLAEVLVYTNRLSDAELASAEAYLNVKWGLRGYVSSFEKKFGVDLAAGATLDCGDAPQHVASLSGSGTVLGDVTAAAVVADGAAAGITTVDGIFTVPAGIQVELLNLSVTGGAIDIPVLSASAFAGLENLASAVFVGEIPAGNPRLRLRVSKGRLVARVGENGLAIIVR